MSKDLSQLDLSHLLHGILTQEFMQQLGELAASEVKKRTRIGYGVADQGSPQQKLKPLEKSTIDKRKRTKARGELAAETTPARSNLTETGQLLDSIKVRLEGGSVVVYLDGERNKLVADHVSKQRPFFNLSKTNQKTLLAFIEAELNKQIRSNK